MKLENNIEKQIKQKSKEYPAYSINQAIEFIEKLKFFPRNKPIAYATAAEELGVKATTKSFTYKVSSAKQYGLITTSAGTLKITDIGNEFLFPTKSEMELKNLKKQCIVNPTLYKELIEAYNTKPLPELRLLSNILVQSYGIIPKVSENAAEIFIQSANELDLIVAGVLDLEETNPNVEENKLDKEKEQSTDIKSVVLSNENMQSNEEYESLVIPLGNQKNAILKFPGEITKKQSNFIIDIIKLTFNQIYGE